MSAQPQPIKTCDTARRTPGVEPFLHPDVSRALQNADFIYQLKAQHHGPIHAIFPHIMRENIRRMQDFFAQYAFETKIHYTCKPNKSKVFIREAFQNGLNIDVSSAEELTTALSVGFHGRDIGCTNLKNGHYLRLALEHGCLISVDNFSELQSIAALHGTMRYKQKTRVLIRLSDLKPKDRQMVPKISKFGTSEADLPVLIDYILAHPDVFDFQGLHFHHDNPLADLHAGYIDHALTLMENIDAKYRSPSRLLNIGGGMRVPNVADPKEWSAFIEHMLQGVSDNLDTGTWNNKAYGMKLSDKGKVEGRHQLEARGKAQYYTFFLAEVLNNNRLRGHPLHRIISDNLLTLVVEPGASLLGHAGFTILRVNGTKRLANCDNAVFVDGNIYNISNQFMEPLTDFIHVPHTPKPNAAPYDAYIIDNLCNERGVMSAKCMYFAQQPEEGDLMIVPNTAAYLSDFEDASPHMHPQGKKIVVAPTENGGFSFYDETYYGQFVQSLA